MSRQFKRRLTITFLEDNGGFIQIVGTSQETDLIVVGQIRKFPFTQMAECDLTIYNLTPIQRGNIIAKNYNRIRVEAGYIDGNFGVIYEGTILRILGGRKDAVTTVARVVSVDSGDFKNFGFISASFDESTNFFEIGEYIAKHGSERVNIELDERLKNFKATGGRSIFGGQYEELDKLATDAGYMFNIDNGLAKIFSKDFGTGVAEVVNANTGMVGVPTLTGEGVQVETLLNPRFQILGFIQLDNASIRNEQLDVIPDRVLGAELSTDGVYKIIKITHEFTNYTGAFKTSIVALSKDMYESINF